MMVKYLLLLTFALAYSAQPMKVGWALHPLTEVVADDPADGRKYTVVSDNGIVIAHQSVLSLQGLNGTLSQVILDFHPDEIRAYNLTSGLHIVAAAHAEQSSVNEVSYCTDRDPGELSCNTYERYTPPTIYVVSVRIESYDTVPTVWPVYYYDDYLTYYNVIGGYEEYSLELPENCTCNSNCLVPVKEPNGRVIVQCYNGIAYLYELYSERFFVLLPEAKQVVTSNYKDLTIVTKTAEGLHQDILVETNMVTDKQSAAALPLAGSLANSSSPVNIRDMAIVSVSKTNQSEVFYFLRNNSILYFKLDELGIYPEIEILPLPPNITLTEAPIRGSYESSIVVEGIYNGSLVLVVIEACEQLRNESVDGMNNTRSNTTLTSTSHTQPDPHSTEPTSPYTTAMPEPTSSADDQTNPAPTSGSGLEPASFVYGIIAGCISTVLIAFVVVVILYRIIKSKGKMPVELPV